VLSLKQLNLWGKRLQFKPRMFEASNMRRTTHKSSYATAICVKKKNELGLPSFEGSFGSSQSTIAAD
jgi:hypothetical protein